MFISEATLFSESSVMVSPTLGHCEQQTLSLMITQCALAAFNQPAQKSLVLHSAEKLCSKSGKLKGRSINYVTHWTANSGDRTLSDFKFSPNPMLCVALDRQNVIKIQE